MTKLGIVGAEEKKFTPLGAIEAQQIIGCWTMWYAYEIGKSTHLHIIDND